MPSEVRYQNASSFRDALRKTSRPRPASENARRKTAGGAASMTVMIALRTTLSVVQSEKVMQKQMRSST